jgi:hypothetical protein
MHFMDINVNFSGKFKGLRENQLAKGVLVGLICCHKLYGKNSTLKLKVWKAPPSSMQQ